MLFSHSTSMHQKHIGPVEGVKMMMDGGFTALDMSFFDSSFEFIRGEDGKALARTLRAEADARGVVFNQAHAPFGKLEHFKEDQLPLFPEIFEFASILGVKNIVVHPLQYLRYYGNEETLFEANMEFYDSIKHFARETGIKIAIENMWQHHPAKKQIVDSVCADPFELCRYYDSLNDPECFTVCLDLGHVALCDREPEDAIKIIGHDRLGALHVHDVDYVSDLHTLPGCSKLHWDAICRALGKIDYKGDFTLESDNFLKNFELEFWPVATKFMADRARFLADKVDAYRVK